MGMFTMLFIKPLPLQNLKLILVEADENLILSRIAERNDEISVEFAKKIRQNFEEPDFSVLRIKNNSDRQNVISQLLSLLSK